MAVGADEQFDPFEWVIDQPVLVNPPQSERLPLLVEPIQDHPVAGEYP